MCPPPVISAQKLKRNFRSRKHARDMCHHLDLEVFKAIDVYHRTKAFGVYFKHKDGWSIAHVQLSPY